MRSECVSLFACVCVFMRVYMCGERGRSAEREREKKIEDQKNNEKDRGSWVTERIG